MNKDQKELELKLDLSKVDKQNNINNKKEIKEINTTSKKKRQKRSSLIAFSTNSNLTTERTSPQRSKRHSVFKEPYKNPRAGINKLFKEKEKKIEKKMSDKKRTVEINFLCKERTRLKKILVLTRDSAALRLLSQKIFKLNHKIAKLIGINEGFYPLPENKKNNKKKKKKKKYYSDDSNSDNEYDDEQCQLDKPLLKKLRRINNYLKINDIYHQGKIIDIHTVISAIKDKPSFMFQREKEKTLYNPSLDYSNDKRKLGFSTVFSKTFSPIGFTKKSYYNKEKKFSLKNMNFEDFFFQINEKNKNKNSTLSSSTIKKTIDKNDKYDISQNRTAACSAKSRPKTSRVTFSLPKSNDFNTFTLTQINNENHYTRNNNYYYTCSNSINNSKFNTFNNSRINFSEEKNNVFIKDKIKEILSDGIIIEDAIKKTIEEQSKKPKKKNEAILLKLANKLSKPKIKINKKKKEIISQEDEYVRKLKLIPYSCKEEYRDCFKKILYQDRILNKPNPNEIDMLEEKMKYIKEQNKIKQEAYQTMYILKENILTGKEDDEVFKEEKIFDSYGNITGLEWLIKKKYVMDEKKKLTGAFNPKEKTHFIIHYPA